MIKLENFEVMGWEHAIRGMRNPKNSWGKSDSGYVDNWNDSPNNLLTDFSNKYFFTIGPNDQKLMQTLANAGPVHGKYLRMITVYVNITAPLYWWKEFDTYKVGTVANSCSTMHKIADKEFTLEDFSHEHLIDDKTSEVEGLEYLEFAIGGLNKYRKRYLETKDKKYWWQMIQLLPSSYNQKRTIMLNYEVLTNIYQYRRNHKLDEWVEFCKWIEKLPYSELITNRSKDE